MKQQSISTRLASIAAELERRRLLQTEPLDPLSASLFELSRELRGLNERGRETMRNELELTEEQFDRFVSDYSSFN